MSLENLSPDSKLWLYQTNRPLSPTEIEWVKEQLENFTKEWAAHGHQLKAAGDVLNPYFVALAVDLTHENASGCSIDASVRFLKAMGKELNVDFFNRLKMLVEMENEEKTLVPFRQISETPENFIYNPLIEKLGDLDSRFRIKVSEFLQVTVN